MTKPLSKRQQSLQSLWDNVTKPDKETMVFPYAIFYFLVFFIPYYSGAKFAKNHLGSMLMSNPYTNVIFISLFIMSWIAVIALFYFTAAVTLLFFKEMQERFICKNEYNKLKKYSFIIIAIYYIAAVIWGLREHPYYSALTNDEINIISIISAAIPIMIVLPIWKFIMYKAFDFTLLKLYARHSK